MASSPGVEDWLWLLLLEVVDQEVLLTSTLVVIQEVLHLRAFQSPMDLVMEVQVQLEATLLKLALLVHLEAQAQDRGDLGGPVA